MRKPMSSRFPRPATVFRTVPMGAAILALAVSLSAVAASSSAESRPIIDYDARYEVHHLSGEALLILDTATGRITTARRSSYSLGTWRKYDLKEVAEQKGESLPQVAPVFENKTIHGRYRLNRRGDTCTFLDSLTGLLWTCRHEDGLLDVWKCWDNVGGGNDTED